MKNQSTAGVLAILIGGLGIHKFYLGKGVQGILYLLFCWTFIPPILGIIEGIRYLTMEEEKFNAIYNPHHQPLSPSGRDNYQQLDHLHELFQKGIITEQEFEQKKKELLRN